MHKSTYCVSESKIGNRLAIGHGHDLNGMFGKVRERLFARLQSSFWR